MSEAMVCSVWAWFVARLEQSRAERAWGCVGAWERGRTRPDGAGVQ